MKILHIINSLNYGGAEKLLLDTVPQYIHQGIETDILLLNNHKTSFYNDLEQKHKVKILVDTKNRNIYNPLHILRIRKYIKQYDIIHAHLFPSLYWLSLATFFLRYNTKFVLTEHSTENRRRNIMFLKYVDRYIYKKYDKIIAISDGVKENLQRHLGSTYKNIVVIHNGIHTKVFREAIPYPKHLLNILEDTKIVIQVSSFRIQKDQETLLRAVALLPENVHVLLVGDGPLKEEKIAIAASLKITHRVHFLGHRTDVPELLKTADINVLSSNYEGFGLAIVEGMAAGKPCVASNVPGLSEVINDAGVLVKSGDHIALKEVLHHLFQDKEYYTKIRDKCLKRASIYDVSKMVTAYTNLYNQL